MCEVICLFKTWSSALSLWFQQFTAQDIWSIAWAVIAWIGLIVSSKTQNKQIKQSQIQFMINCKQYEISKLTQERNDLIYQNDLLNNVLKDINNDYERQVTLEWYFTENKIKSNKVRIEELDLDLRESLNDYNRTLYKNWYF